MTHPLAVAYMGVCTFGTGEAPSFVAWSAAGKPLYADPTPMPAPALGMRVWRVVHDEHDGCRRRTLGGVDISVLTDGPTKTRWTSPETIDLITDYRTGEVLWRRA